MRSRIDLELCLHLYRDLLLRRMVLQKRRSSLFLLSLSLSLSRSFIISFLFWTLFIFQFLSAAVAILSERPVALRYLFQTGDYFEMQSMARSKRHLLVNNFLAKLNKVLARCLSCLPDPYINLLSTEKNWVPLKCNPSFTP